MRDILSPLMGWRYWVVAAGMLCFSGFAGVVAGSPLPQFDLRVVAHELPSEIGTGAVISVPLTLANDGTESWSSDRDFFLSYHWLDEHGTAVIWDGSRTRFQGGVQPGDEVRINASVEAPRSPGSYALVWDVVREGEMWLSSADPTPVASIAVGVVNERAFATVGGAAPRLLVAGRETRVRLAVRNEGALAWQPGGGFAVSYHWLDRHGSVVNWDGRRGVVSARVDPGEVATFAVPVAAPQKAGIFRLQWDMVEEGVCWFSDRLPEPPPSFAVVVVPNVFSNVGVWALLSLLAAAAAVAVLREAGPRWLIAIFAVSDVFWCAGSLVVKQGFVLAGAGTTASGSGRALMAGSAAFIALILLLLPGAWRRWSTWTVAAAGTLVLFGDAVFVRFFRDLPAPEILDTGRQLGRVEASVRSLLELGDLWMWVDLLPGLVLVLVASRLRQRAGSRVRKAAALVLAAIMTFGAVAGVRLALQQPDLLNQVFRRVLVAREIGVLNLHALDLGRRAASSVATRALDPADRAALEKWFSDRAGLRAGVEPWFGSARGRNLIMIQVESLQGFVIGLRIEGREVTPFLNRWVGEALWFSNVTDQTAQGRSSDSELATQVSLLPSSTGAAAFRFADNDFTGLAEILTEQGYTTLSAVPYDGSFWNRRSTHRAYGYAESLFVDDFSRGDTVGWGLSDRDFFRQIGQRLATVERPFAAYLLTLSLHHPFDGFPDQFKSLDVGRWKGTPFGNFLHTMHFLDSSLSELMNQLEIAGLADSTVVAVWGDHDAGFPWRPDIASAMGASHDPEGWYLSQEVPLFIRVPESTDLRGERTIAAGHVDVAPTLLALLGVDPSPYAFVGRNLLGTSGDPAVVGEYGCWRNDRLLFLQGNGSLNDGVCLDLSTMDRVPAESCREGYFAARRTVETSMRVLEHDLQGTIHEDLVRRETDMP